MSKAIFVLDEMPEKCENCQFHRSRIGTFKDGDNVIANYGIELCGAENPSKPIARYLEENKPNWCPLKELPERRPDDPINQAKLAEKEDLPIDWTQAYCTGWNACYDKISGAED